MHQSRVTLVRMKTATHGADEGRLDLQKSVLTSSRQKFCESATARPHDGAVKWGQRLPNSRFVPSPRCSNKITILCKHIEACSCTSYCDMHVPVQCVRLLIAPTILPLSTVCIRSHHARHAGVPSIKDQWASEREISCEFDHTESSERSETVRVGSERFFSLSLERQRSAGEMASFGTYSPPFVLDRQQKF